MPARPDLALPPVSSTHETDCQCALHSPRQHEMTNLSLDHRRVRRLPVACKGHRSVLVNPATVGTTRAASRQSTAHSSRPRRSNHDGRDRGVMDEDEQTLTEAMRDARADYW